MIDAAELEGLEAVLRNTVSNVTHNYMLIITKDYMLNKAMNKDYEAAQSVGLPIMLVKNMDDVLDGMNQLDKNKTFVNNYIISSHGNTAQFHFGNDIYFMNESGTSLVYKKDRFDHENDATPGLRKLSNYLAGSTLVITACNTGRDDRGALFTQKIANITKALTITSEGTVDAGYSYDGTRMASGKYFQGLMPNDGIPWTDFYIKENGKFRFAVPGRDTTTELQNVTIDRNKSKPEYETSNQR